ncbi:MAG: phosphotransferase, partial [Egibacteraceae bacterium]
MDRTWILEDTLREVVRACVGQPGAVLGRWRVHPVVDPPTNFATAALVRVSGTACHGDARLPWSLVVKRVQSLRHSPGLALMPEAIRESSIAAYPWRCELDAYGRDLATRLPAGLRAPVVYLIEEHPDDRATLWMEDVATDQTAVWDLDRYARAARLLGRMAARRRPADGSGYEPAEGTRRFCEAALVPGMIPVLRDPAIWRHPLVAAAVDPNLRADLLRLADQLPDLLAALRALPQ